MQTEGLGLRIERKSLDVIQIILLVAGCERVVETTSREWVSLDEDVAVDVAPQDGLNQTDILLLCDSATVVDLGSEHVEHLVGYLVVCFHELLQLASADDQIFVGEGVGDIPADGTELSSVLDDGVEEAEAEEDLLVDLWLGALFEFFLR